MQDNQYASKCLMFAVRKGRLERVRELISSFGLCSSRSQSGGYGLLLYAVSNRHTEIANLLLANGCKVNSVKKTPVNSPLHHASRNGEVELVHMLLDKGAIVDGKNGNGETPLHNAVISRKIKIVELLLTNRANVNNKNKSSVTPLHLAAEDGSEDILKLLIRSGANVDAKREDGKTSLHIAVDRGNSTIVEHLLNHGASVNSTYICKIQAQVYTALRLAVEKRYEKVVKLLLEYGANIDAENKDHKTILHFAVKNGSSIMTEHILKHYPDLNNKSNNGVLNVAVQGYGEGSSKIVKNLLEYGFTVSPEDANNSELLLAAVRKGYLTIVEEFLKYGIDVNMFHKSIYRDSWMPLHVATTSRQEEVAKLLISCGADVNAEDKSGKTPIFYATDNADLKITKLLLTNKANVKDNPELLTNAVKKKYREIIQVLLQHGADINSSDKYGRTALHFTALNKRGTLSTSVLDKDPDINVKGEIAKLLLCRGANVNTETKDGVTALQAAAYNGYANIVEALLEYNTDVNFTYETDVTPFPQYAPESNEGINTMPLNKGADINTMHRNRITPLHIATHNGHKEVVEVLLKRGFKINCKIRHDITPLHIAVQKGHLEIVKVLLKFGACVDSKDEYGATALHIASKKGHAQIVIALLEHGSDITIMNGDNDTALNLAEDVIDSLYERRSRFDSDDEYIFGLNDIFYAFEDYDDYHDDYCDSDGYSYDSVEEYSSYGRNYSYNLDYNSDSDDDYYDHDAGLGIYTHVAQAHITQILKCHMIKVKTANLYASNKDLLSISSDDEEMSNFQNECEKEVASMKREKFGNSSISFYDVLTKGTSQLAIYAGNKSIVQVFKSNNWKVKFPIYDSMINSQFKKGRRRKMLLDQGNTSFHFFFNNFPGLPYYCTEYIFSYLSDEDLRTLMAACRPISVSSIDINNMVITSNISKVSYT